MANSGGLVCEADLEAGKFEWCSSKKKKKRSRITTLKVGEGSLLNSALSGEIAGMPRNK